MSELNRVDTTLLEVIAGMKDGKAEGAFNIRKDSGCAGRVNTENVTITTKTDKPGIDIRFVPGCKDSCHIPVIITESGLRETVYNDFYVGDGADVTIIAGCGIHNCGSDASKHDGVHTFCVDTDGHESDRRHRLHAARYAHRLRQGCGRRHYRAPTHPRQSARRI